MTALTLKQARQFYAPLAATKLHSVQVEPRDTIDEVIALSRRFGPIWGQTPAKTGYLGTHGSKDATTDEVTLRCFWTEHPEAVPALLTGEASGIVALDIDIKNGRNGLDVLEELGFPFNPETPTAHTPTGGLHWLFRWPEHFVRSTCDAIGAGLEVKGDRCAITLPPGPGRCWDAILGPATPLAPMPAWMAPEEKKPVQLAQVSKRLDRSTTSLTRYGEVAFDDAIANIIRAPAGAQERTLNAESYALGQLAAGGEIPEGLAVDALMAAARRLPSYDRSRPWNVDRLAQKIRRAFDQGKAMPRSAA